MTKLSKYAVLKGDSYSGRFPLCGPNNTDRHTSACAAGCMTGNSIQDTSCAGSTGRLCSQRTWHQLYVRWLNCAIRRVIHQRCRVMLCRIVPI